MNRILALQMGCVQLLLPGPGTGSHLCQPLVCPWSATSHRRRWRQQHPRLAEKRGDKRSERASSGNLNGPRQEHPHAWHGAPWTWARCAGVLAGVGRQRCWNRGALQLRCHFCPAWAGRWSQLLALWGGNNPCLPPPRSDPPTRSRCGVSPCVRKPPPGGAQAPVARER